MILRPLMPPRELHHLVNTSLASHSSWSRPGAPTNPASETTPRLIEVAVTPRPVAMLWPSPLPHTDLNVPKSPSASDDCRWFVGVAVVPPDERPQPLRSSKAPIVAAPA